MQENKTDKINNLLNSEKSSKNRSRVKFISSLLEQQGTISVRIRKPIYEEAKKHCAVTGVSINDYISASVAQRLWWELEDDNK